MRLFTWVLILTLQFSLNAQNMGVKLPVSTLPNTTLDVNGSTAFREGSAINLTAAVNTDVVLGDYSFFRITGATTAFSITGFTNGTDGRVLTLINATSQRLTLTHQATSGVNNQINTGGSDLALAANGVAILIYNFAIRKWVVTGGQGFVTDWSLAGNSGTIDGIHFIGTTDDRPLSIRVNNFKAGRIDALGQTLLGFQAGNVNAATTTTAVGYQAGLLNSTGSNNTYMGYQAGLSNTIGTSNTFIGYLAGTTNLDGNTNVALGTWALTANTNGSGNVALGSGSLGQNTIGNSSIAIGTQAGSGGTTGSNHIYIGFQSGTGTSSGNNNTFIGYNAGHNVAASDNNTLLGYATSASSGLTNSTAIGNRATVTASNSLVLGGTGANAVNVGIGTTAPNQQLEITAAFRMPVTTSNSTGVFYKGANRFIHDYKPASNDGNNTFIGVNAGNFTMSSATSWLASGNTGIGANALTALTTAGYNTAVGVNALAANTTGNYNMAFCSQALSSNISGVGNVAVGHSSLEKNTASSNTAIGNASMSLNTTGTGLVAVGESAMLKNTIGNYNTSVGQSAMRENIDGSNNTALGLSALQLNISGSYNVAVGTSSLTDNLTGSNNTAIGYDALSAATSSNNVALGYAAGTGTTTGGNNVFIGHNTGLTNVTGSNNTLVGYDANVLSSGLTNATAIGYLASVSSSNSLILGGTGANAVRVGIGTSNPAAKLEIKTGPSNNGIMLTSSTTSVFGSLISVDPNINVAANTPVNSLWFTQSENADIAMGTNNTTRFWIKANGNVGIGVNDPSHILHISGQGRSTNSAWATTSDIRLKNIDKPFEYGLKELIAINTYRFHYKENNALKLPSDKGFQGVMAQELQKVIPEAVIKQADGYFTVNTDPVFWTMLNSVKEINTANLKLKSESDALKLELEQVKTELKKQQALTEKVFNHSNDLKVENTVLKASVEKNRKDIEMIKAMLGKK
jgi:trimeric autotransporter adhesin